MKRKPVRIDYGSRLARACSDTQIAAGLGSEVRLEQIATAACDAFLAQWQTHPSRKIAWNWAQIAPDFRRRNPKGFNVAIWHGDTLGAGARKG
jgi:hypothetical protein